MQSVLIVINNLECGGIQKALIDFLKVLVRNYDVSLRCFSQTGMLLDQVPPEVNILESSEKLSILAESMQQLKAKSSVLYVKKAIWTIVAWIIGAPAAHFLYYTGIAEKKNYDIAISYTQDVSGYSFSVGCNDYVKQCVRAKKKLTFVHCDFKNYGGNDALNRKRYKNFDSIVCVSNSCKKEFDCCCPEYRRKSIVLMNSIDENEILKLANEKPFCYDDRYINYITVARVSKEKGIMRALKVMKTVIELSNEIRWYIVGTGPEMEEARHYIAENNLMDVVFLLGESENPYRFMRGADCLFVPSYHECAPVVFAEACTLHLPTLTTRTLSAVELVENNNVGWVCDNTEEGILQGLLRSTTELKDNSKSVFSFSGVSHNTLQEFDSIIGGIR